MWVEPLERVHRPQGLTEIPSPPGTAGISVNPAPEKIEKEERAKRSSKPDRQPGRVKVIETSRRDDTHPRPAEERERARQSKRKRPTNQNDKG